jgi:hypothetical protein
LREVEILFVAGEAVKKEDDRVRACSFGDVGEGVEHGSVTGNLEGFHCCGIGFVGRGVSCDGRRELLRLKREMKRGAQKCEVNEDA